MTIPQKPYPDIEQGSKNIGRAWMGYVLGVCTAETEGEWLAVEKFDEFKKRVLLTTRPEFPEFVVEKELEWAIQGAWEIVQHVKTLRLFTEIPTE